ncbi:putative flagellar biosynthetic protein flhB [Pseudooceanicola batsensis HTCC2597]|uniref:Flagellar biosynthetic protein FlhB n=1 Tax=Pseudooceanicola batsensis (strain ATCC BAA-863 / DSM 15984 / KCTC 12145 / HTCC2597) TaxID=252305 RepID=A3U133_PSEBH|nr:flagellar biosynthesis protein FlhB [Pseudooceanicola batsensis]EAQ02016.1 putative flagellar biosynthetic protein flhB [Pseudooceanicola batsensis HTCC2597]
MAENEDQTNKTEEPTPRKLRQAREKGDVPSSREVGNMMSVMSLFLVAIFFLPQLGPTLVGTLRRVFENAGQVRIGEDVQGLRDLGQVTMELSGGLATVLAPVAATMLLAAVAAVLIQGEVVVAVDRITPKLSKINPIQGFKKIFSIDSFVEFLKSVAKVLVVGGISIYIAQIAVRGIWQTEGVTPESVLSYIGRYAALLLITVTLLLTVLSVADVMWKRFQWMKKQRMSVQEIRDEHKEMEGDPLIRAKRAEQRRKRAQQRITTAVPQATVVLTNPTHFAVALRYDNGTDQAPVCVAKGVDLMAAQVRKVARENEVPVVENKPLARALYDVAEIDEEIPFEHWQAVAEIIGYVMDLKHNLNRQPPAGSSLRWWD